MKNTTFNIGLNNNPFSYEEVVTIITDSLQIRRTKVQAQLREGLYCPDDETIVFEPTAVIRVLHEEVYQDDVWAEMMSETFCAVFTQECIPYRHIELKEGNMLITEQLVYHPQFDGDKYDFDGQYFIEFADKVN